MGDNGKKIAKIVAASVIASAAIVGGVVLKNTAPLPVSPPITDQVFGADKPSLDVAQDVPADIAVDVPAAISPAVIVKPSNSMSFSDWQSYVKMVDYEAKQSANGQLILKGVSGSDDLKKKLDAVILARPVTEKTVTLDGMILTTKDYADLRSSLIQKVEK